MRNGESIVSQDEVVPPSSKSISFSSQRDLADKRSVRTTFRLSEEASKGLVWLAKHHGVKFKDVFDHLCEKLVQEAVADGDPKARPQIDRFNP